MEAATKRARSAGGSAARDWLSGLPDDLLLCVLSFLPTRQVVWTTLLSKRWVDLWRLVPAINLRIRDFGWQKMKDFTTNLLMLHNAECLDVFKLAIVFIREDTRKFADRWIRHGLEYNPVVLDVTVPNSRRSYQSHFPGLGSSLSRLKKLALTGMHLDHSFAKQISSGCPVLEDLVLRECRNEFPAIQSDTLKSLVVRYCTSETADALLIRAPALSSMRLHFPHYNYKNVASLEAGHSLVRASISLIDGNVSQGGEIEMLRSLFNVTSLELEHRFSAKAVLDLDKEFGELPIFHNMRTLSFNYCFYSECDVHKFKALGRFLHMCPTLEKLTLKGFRYSEGSERAHRFSGKPWVKTVKPVIGPIEFPMLQNLRTLFLDECDLRDKYRLLRHFLENTPNLEKLTIRICKLPGTSNGDEGIDMHFQCQNLKSTEIIYKKCGKIPELVSILLDISGPAPNNTITLTKF